MFRHSSRHFITVSIVIIAVFTARASDGGQDSVGTCLDSPVFAVKSNLLHDAVITPDLAVEVMFPSHISVNIEGVCAWWSNRSANRYWRVRGVWLDISWWFRPNRHASPMSGHHVGFYTSLHDFDFEFGRKGWQSQNPAVGIGCSYGYSFPLNASFNLDFHMRFGYVTGRVTHYVPQCGAYVRVWHCDINYLGLTDLGISLVWFPGGSSPKNLSR